MKMNNFKDRDINISEYVPDVLRDVTEYKAIMAVQNPCVIQLWLEIDKAFDSQFILQAPLEGIEMFEQMHHIIPFDSETLEDRRYRLWLLYNQAVPFTRRWLNERLEILLGRNNYTVEYDTEHFNMTVFFNVEIMKSVQTIVDLLEMCLPANMSYGVPINYRTHKWLKDKGLTHGQMRAYTHKEIKTIILQGGTD